MKRICSICARGGSKGVPNKNLTEIAGKPLIAYSIRAAIESGMFDTVSISSDSDRILEVSKAFGANLLIKRPAELSTDTAAKLPVIQHCFTESERLAGTIFDTIVDLDCTSPLRSVDDIIRSIALFESSPTAENLITGSPARRSPYFNLVQMKGDGRVELAGKPDKPVLRRQDAPKCFDMNASIYIWRRETLLRADKVVNENTILFEMPEERSIDIDSPFDFEIVSFLLERKLHGRAF